MKKLGFKKIFQKLYMIQKDIIICFFYRDNIMFAFKNNQHNKIEKTIIFLLKVPTIERKKELKWLLGLYIIRDHLKKAL